MPDIRNEYDFFKPVRKPRVEVHSVSTFDKRVTPTVSAKTMIQASPKRHMTVFKTGDRVSHGIFGKGTVKEAKKVGSDILYLIDFDMSGEKKLMATYAKLKPENKA